VRRLALERHIRRTDPLSGLTTGAYGLRRARPGEDAEQVAAEPTRSRSTPAILPFEKEDGTTR
jgi:hypothetical protein